MSKFDDTPRRRKSREKEPLTKKDLGIDTREDRAALRAKIHRKDLRENRAFKGACRNGLHYYHKKPKKTAKEKEQERIQEHIKMELDFERFVNRNGVDRMAWARRKMEKKKEEK